MPRREDGDDGDVVAGVAEVVPDMVVPAPLALDDPWLNSRLVRETFAGVNRKCAALTSAVLAGR